MSVARKILSNTFAQIIGKAIVVFLGIATLKIISNYLSVAGLGEYNTVYEFLAFFGIAADLGLFTIAVKEMSKDEEKIPKLIGNILTLRTFLVVSTMALAVITAFFIPKYSSTRIPLGVAIASITVILSILNGTISSVLQTKLQMHWAALSSIIGKIITVGFMIYVVFYGFPNDTEQGFYMLMVAGIIGNLAMLISTSFFVRKITKVRYRFDIDLWKEVLVKSLPYGLALILSTIYFRIDTLLLGFMKDQEEVGLYSFSMKILEHFTIIPLYFMNSILPVLTRKIQEKSDRAQTIVRYAFDFLAAVSIPMVVGAYVLAYPIVFALGQPDLLSNLAEGYFGSDIALQILIFALAFQFLNTLFAFVLLAVNQQTKLLYINGGVAIFNLVTNIIFIPVYGFRGAAVTTVISEAIILAATFLVARNYLKIRLNLINLIKIIISALVMGAAVMYLQPVTYDMFQNWNLLLLIPAGAIIYTIMIFLTRTVDKEMLQLIKRK